MTDDLLSLQLVVYIRFFCCATLSAFYCFRSDAMIHLCNLHCNDHADKLQPPPHLLFLIKGSFRSVSIKAAISVMTFVETIFHHLM